MTFSGRLFLASVLTLPLQLNKFFFGEFSYVLGIPIDYRAIAIYLSDIFIVAYLCAFLFENRKKLREIYKARKNFVVAIFLLNYYLILSSFLSSVDSLASINFNLKTLELSLFAVLASITLTKKKIFNLSIFVLAFSGAWQSFLLIFQFILQRSLGLWFLGERAFDTSTPSIAHASFLGNFWLRPYGTFPHPNVAAAFLTLTLIILIAYFPKTRQFSFLRSVAIAASIFGVLITFSKAAILVFLVSLITVSGKIKYFIAKGLLFIVLLIAFFLLFTEGQLASIAERFTLAQAALDIYKTSPLFGVGSNNFILELSKLNLISIGETRLLQPVHNVFLLILAENGIIGLLLFAYLLFVIFKNTNTKPKFALFLSLLIFMSVDHFFLTLQQGQFLFWFTLAFIISSPNKSIS